MKSCETGDWKSDLERLRLARQTVREAQVPLLPRADEVTLLNPTLSLLVLEWKNLCMLLEDSQSTVVPERGRELVLLYRCPGDGAIRVAPASRQQLLALKLYSEKLDREQVAGEAGVDVGRVDAAVAGAARQGIILQPPSKILRTIAHYPDSGTAAWGAFLQSRSFTLQWHVTQACDLHCKHCYDRSTISPLTLGQGINILDQFRDFVIEQRVQGQVTFTGGNPLLYSHFEELYQEAARRNFGIAILGNPTERKVVEKLQAIQPLSFYQVSLEGLSGHNDSIRGEGHFARVMAFLKVLKGLSVYSMVMLTLTRENMGQVLELAELLRGKVDLFTFNRLSQTGEGADLAAVEVEGYRRFLEGYLDAAKDNPVISLKDNLINVIKAERGDKAFGGCTGFGCGAAFNFCSLLPNGDLHACRKFQSPIGNVLDSTLLELYRSEAAEQYRLGPGNCRGCRIRPVCGGCQAVIHSSGLDSTLDRDPYCFMAPAP